MLSRIPRLASAARRLAVANVTRLRSPLKVTFALTYWCQYRCKTCNIWKLRPADELTTDEVLAFVARNRGVSWLDVTGGEIFLRKDIDEVLAAFASWKSLAILHFPTNGFLTDRIVAACERLPRQGPQVVVTVSVDGDEALNDEVRGITGGFARQMATFRALRRIRGIRPVIGMTLSAHNAGALERTFLACRRACPDLRAADFHVNVAQVSGHYYRNRETAGVAPAADAAIRELRLYRSMRGMPRSVPDWVESTYLRHLESYLRTGATPMRCHSLRSSCFIDPWGTVFPCITYTRPLGSLREHGMSLGPIWSAAATGALQQDIWTGQCPNCWTACEAYQSILGNLVRGAAAVPAVAQAGGRAPVPLRSAGARPSAGEP
jgi:MoaA/NifB/PqqE/SkfB family radical SAM enzyme